jgi:hypothetical protein
LRCIGVTINGCGNEAGIAATTSITITAVSTTIAIAASIAVATVNGTTVNAISGTAVITNGASTLIYVVLVLDRVATVGVVRTIGVIRAILRLAKFGAVTFGFLRL